MMDLNNVLKIPYLRFNFLIIILILSLITVINYFFTGISLFLTLFLSVGLIGANFSSNLKEYNLKTIIKIFEFSLIYFIATFLFLIFQGVFAIVLAVPILALRGSIDVENILAFNSTMLLFLILLIIIIFGLLILEFIKNIGFIKYCKNKKFEHFFEFKKNLKIIFTKNFLIGILFLFGYLLLILIIMFFILIILNLLIPSLGFYFTGVLVIIYIYLMIGASFTTFNEIYKAHK